MKKLRIKGVNNPRDMVQPQTDCLLSFYVILLPVCYCQLQQHIELFVRLLSVCLLHSLIHIHTHIYVTRRDHYLNLNSWVAAKGFYNLLSFNYFSESQSFVSFHLGALHTELQKIDPSLAVLCQLVQFFNLSSHSLEVKNPLEEKNTFHLTR